MPGLVKVNIQVTHVPIREIEGKMDKVITDALTLVGSALMERVTEVTGIRRQSLQELAAMGHPFSYLMGGGGLNPGYVNFQSGEFYRGFDLTPVWRDNGIHTLRLVNHDEKAEMLRLGTPTMVPRPYMKEISKGFDRIFAAVLLEKLSPGYGFKLRGVR
jgi:hypothetical protein